MVTRENLKKKYALISVYDKNRLRYLCKNLIKNDYQLVSTGSTGSIGAGPSSLHENIPTRAKTNNNFFIL